MNKVYVTPRSISLNGHPSLEKLKNAGFEVILGPPGKRPTEEEQSKILPDCVAYLAGTEPIQEKVLKTAKNLKIISRNGVGIENIDLDAAENLGIEIATTPGSNAQGVAELSINLMLTSARSVISCNENLKKGEWKRVKGIELAGRILGVIGTGSIGKKVINMALGLGMKVLGHDLRPDENFDPSPDFKYALLDELLMKSDVISLHCPPSEKPLLDDNAIKKLKSGVILINTARAGLVEEKPILEALNKKKIRTYATDVYKTEPPGFDDLISHENVICTPHIGAYTEESIDRAAEDAVDNILKKFGLM